MRTEQLHATRIRIYPQDAFPLWDVTSAVAINYIRKALRFEQVQPAQPEDKSLPAGVMFGRGRSLAAESNAPASIENLVFGPSQLDLTTRDADGHKFNDAVLQELSNLCNEIIPKQNGWLDTHRIELFQTVWVGELNLDPDGLIDVRAKQVLFPTLCKEHVQKGTRIAQAKGMAIKVTTKTADPALLELGLQIPDEEFKLEPRAGRLASERIWFSTSALRSEDHLRLLEDLERAYSS